jgi:archaetidylinositol phosphate synthase
MISGIAGYVYFPIHDFKRNPMPDPRFKGDKKLPLKSPFAKIERRFIDALTPRFPAWIEGYHLTLMTIPLCVLCILSGRLARTNLAWLWATSFALFAQWFTDSFDGALGRYRDTGIPKWGYFMDHLLDYVFMCSLLLGYAWLFNGTTRILWLLLIPVFGTFFVNSYLSFAATHDFKITFLGFGPTELRLLLIGLNTLIICAGPRPVEAALPYLLPFFAIMICVVVFRSQKFIWSVDMSDKADRKGP